MGNNFYTATTAALKATKADVRNLNAQEIKLKDKNILDYIKDSEFNSYDTRDPQLKNDELDIWNTEISLSDNGHIEVKPLEHTNEQMTDGQKELLLNSAVKVIDNEVLGENDEHLMYWQTDGLTDACYIVDKDDDGEDDAELSVFCHYDYYDGRITNLKLTSFSSDLSSLTGGEWMFCDCTNLTSFTSNLSSLTNGVEMFYYCSNLTTFSSDLSSLTYGGGMFDNCTSLTSFNCDNLSSLMDGTYMFNNCTSLTTFSSDLTNLTNGESMLQSCISLTSFNGNLSSLKNANQMFDGCLLNAQSVANIIHALTTHETGGEITIGIGCDDTEEDQLLFAQECDCETWQELIDDFSAKNWTVYVQYNGRPTTTYNMRRGETLPIYAKLEEVIMPTDENEHKPHYAYTSADGSKFYNIHYFHSTNGSTEGYDVFSSLEEAISTYNVTPKN